MFAARTNLVTMIGSNEGVPRRMMKRADTAYLVLDAICTLALAFLEDMHDLRGSISRSLPAFVATGILHR